MKPLLQEHIYFIIVCFLMVSLLLFSLLAMLASEYLRWQRFMERQKIYFQNLAVRKVREKERERNIGKRKGDFIKQMRQGIMSQKKEILAQGHSKPGQSARL